MAKSFDISNKINEVRSVGGDAPQNGASQPHSACGPVFLAALHPQATAEIQPRTTEGVTPNSENPDQAAAPATSLVPEVLGVDVDTGETVEAEWADEDFPAAANYEKIDDTEELAHNLVHSGLAPHCHPRIEVLFRRAASGRGYHSQLIRTSGLI